MSGRSLTYVAGTSSFDDGRAAELFELFAPLPPLFGGQEAECLVGGQLHAAVRVWTQTARRCGEASMTPGNFPDAQPSCRGLR